MMNRLTGNALATEIAHLRQSVQDILTTPLGSRVMRRTYGSRLPELVDAPLNEDTKLDLITATAEALRIWEPRLVVKSIQIQSVDAGKITLSLEGEYRVQSGTLTTPINLNDIVVN
jgi:hypothetical protein